jgi:hypothetical protein
MTKDAISIAKLKQSNEWRIVSELDDADPYIVMHRCPVGVPADRDGYEGFLSFQWVYDDEGSFRLANELERELIDSLTGAINRRFEVNNIGVLLFTMESNGLCQWIIITTDPNQAMIEAIEASSENPGTKKYFGEKFGRFNTQIFHDPKWEQIKKIQRLFRAKSKS